MNAIMTGISLGLKLVEEIIQMVKSGATDEDIRQRLADPGGAAQALLDGLRATETKIDDYIKKG